MNPDDPLDAVTGSISDGDPVDWDLAESGTKDENEQASLRALREVERVASGYRALHGSSAPDGNLGPGEGASRGKPGRMQWGELTVLELARAGASGEVWRAWDPWLQREVALKFLHVPSGSVSSSVGDSALLNEARALARVRHPGIVAVYGIAEHEGRVGMWMEFLEGTTLAAEIERRGSLPPLEVAQLGLALCRALEAVESAGVVHRDIKPTNVVLETTGRVVLTDFGLGRRWELADRAWRASGTPVFMSPGVLSGEPATPRSDIYALGVTLRWALTGHSPFRSRSIEELEVEAKTGPSTTLAAEQPDAHRALIGAIDRAMAPNAEARYGSAAEMTAALESAFREMTTRGSSRHEKVRRTVFAIAGLALVVLATAVLSRFFATPAKPTVARFSVMAPENNRFDLDPTSSAISPDGLQLAIAMFDSSGTSRLWLRPLNAVTPRLIEGTEGATQPFWSPDGRNVAFFAWGKLKKVAVTGGPPEVLCAASDARGGSWGSSGVIVFAPVPAGPLNRISSEGGPVSQVLQPDSARHETALRWPEFLPDGKHFLFVSLPPRDGSFDVHVSSIDSPERRVVLRSDAAPIVAGKDQLILSRNGRLMAQRFDFRALRPVGEPIALGPSTSSDVSVGERLASASMNGVLVQQSATLENTQLVWLDRAGRRLATPAIPEGRYEKVSISPDGRRVVAVRRTSQATVDLWMIEWERGLATRLASKSQTRIGGTPTWSPDGRRVAFSSNRDGPTNIYLKDVDQGSAEEVAYKSSAQFKEVDVWSPDGRFVVFEQVDPVTNWDLWLLPMHGERKPTAYLRSNFNEFACSISPDGKWLAYWSDESGKQQIYVQTFPVPGEKHLISAIEAAWVAWSKDGREIVMRGVDQTFWSIPVVTEPDFKVGTPKRMFRYSGAWWWTAASPDLRRFLVLAPAPGATPSLTVELNWQAAVGGAGHARMR